MKEVKVLLSSGETIKAVVPESDALSAGSLLYEAAECKDCNNMDLESCPSNIEDWHAQSSVTISGGDPLYVTRKNWRGS